MNENEFDLDFDFEKEYGIDPPKEEDLPMDEPDLDLSELLGADFGADPELFNSEYTANFDYGPETEDYLPETPEPDVAGDFTENPAEEYAPALPDEQLPAENGSEEPVSDLERRSQERKSGSGKPRKPMSPMRKFKNEKLPLIIMGVAALLCVIFIIGSLSRVISAARSEKESIKDASESAISAEQRLQQEAKELLDEAATLATGYDYQGAIDLLNTFSGDSTKFTEIETRKSEYEMAKSQLVAHNDPSEVVNLSFHVLVADPERAYKDATYKGSYNKNFVTTDEFKAILEQLYANNYVLVDMDSFVAEDSTGDTVTYSSKSLYLPDGKKPIMITETYGYLLFMVDSNGDGEADANGGGFASRLVLDDYGDVKAEIVNADGSVDVGNYALVPILEDFIEEHPDFCYQGARAILATTGYNGVFGYRINADVKTSKGQEYYDQQVAGAKEIVAALRAKGYEIACYTYANENYGDSSSDAIQTDINKWNNEIVPVIGPVDTLVYAKNSDISTTGNYSGSKYTVLKDAGFRYFITSGSSSSCTINGEYVRQVRLMVTGSQMYHSASMYTNFFDAKSVLNSLRGNVPQ